MKSARNEIMKLCIKMLIVVGVESVGEAPVGEAPIALYMKLRKTRTLEVIVMQKILIGKLSNLAHVIFTNGCLYQCH